MIVQGDDQAKQDNKSGRAAITGLSHFQADHKYFSPMPTNHNWHVLDLAKDALRDDGAHALSANDNICIIVCHIHKSDGTNQSKETISARQLSFELNLQESKLSFDEQIAHPWQGFNLAIDKLNSAQCDAVLLVLNDLDSAAFVIRRAGEAATQNKRIYASIALLTHLDKNSDYSQLLAKYRQAGLSPKSIHQLIFDIKSANLNIQSQVAQLSRLFFDINETGITPPNVLNKAIAPQDSWCSLRPITLNDQQYKSAISSMVESILALQQKVLLPIVSENIIEQLDLKKSPFYFNVSLRSWFHPQIHAQLRQDHPQPGYIPSLRRCAIHSIDQEGAIYHLVLEECEDIAEAKRSNRLSDWPSELFTFYGNDRFELTNYIQDLQNNLPPLLPELRDLSFTINTHTASLIDQSFVNETNKQSAHNKLQPIHLAFICANAAEFLEKLKLTLDTLQSPQIAIGRLPVLNQNQDIYWSNASPQIDGAAEKVAFVLPGLGAAYPHMLLQLCLHFPEVRAIFDYIDVISNTKETDPKPSDRIFPRIDPLTKSSRETAASLAVMDSAVVTVLMAEWAIFTLLLNLGITADALLGSSTGEFAALTMSGAVDIMKAAPLFYHLSTGMVRALPLDQLIKLRSIKVSAALEDIKQDLNNFSGQIYLSANLSPKQLILTGDKEAINSLAKLLDNKNITADFLPFAIPYHTPLVSGVVSLDNPDIQALQITNPLIESWSCSLAAPYPAQPETIRKMTTDLFSKPILFRESIEALYRKGIRTFIEVGPRGNLAPVVSETLNERPHTVLAANRSDIPAITQIQHVLAALFTSGVYIDLNYLYARRSPEIISIATESSRLVPTEQPIHSPFATAENMSAEIANISSTITALSEAYQHQLAHLETQVMSYLGGQRSAVLSKSSHGKEADYLSQELSLAKIFPQLNNEYCQNIICRQTYIDRLPSNEEALSSLAYSMLTSAEATVFSSFGRLDKRKEWLAGRIAVKEAIRHLTHNLSGQAIDNQSIQIDTLPSGQPYVNSSGKLPEKIISITHKAGKAIAVAAPLLKFKSIGVDLESITSADDVEEFILNDTEQQYLNQLNRQERARYVKSIWSAKEAAAKALGLGLPEYMTRFSVADNVYQSNQITIKYQDIPNKIEPELLKAHIALQGDMILALVIRQ